MQVPERINVKDDELEELTPQQAKFVEGLLEGQKGSDAYRAAYDCSNSKESTIWANASRLKSNPKVAAWLDAARQAGVGRAGMTQEQYLLELRSMMSKAERMGDLKTSLSSLVEIGQVSGHRATKIEVTHNNPAELLAEISKINPDVAKAIAQSYALPLQLPETIEHEPAKAD